MLLCGDVVYAFVCSSVLCLRLVFLFAVALYVAVYASVYASVLRFRVVLLLVLMFSVYWLCCLPLLCICLCVLLFCFVVLFLYASVWRFCLC